MIEDTETIVHEDATIDPLPHRKAGIVITEMIIFHVRATILTIGGKEEMTCPWLQAIVEDSEMTGEMIPVEEAEGVTEEMIIGQIHVEAAATEVMITDMIRVEAEATEVMIIGLIHAEVGATEEMITDMIRAEAEVIGAMITDMMIDLMAGLTTKEIRMTAGMTVAEEAATEVAEAGTGPHHVEDSIYIDSNLNIRYLFY